MRIRSILLVPILALALMVAGCANTKSIFLGGSSLIASISNPVTPTMLYDVEQGLTVAVTGMLTYKRLCIQKAVPPACRGVVVQLQGYAARARPILVRLRAFVRNNDQVNAIQAYNEVRAILLSFQTTATAAAAATGVK